MCLVETKLNANIQFPDEIIKFVNEEETDWKLGRVIMMLKNEVVVKQKMSEGVAEVMNTEEKHKQQSIVIEKDQKLFCNNLSEQRQEF